MYQPGQQGSDLSTYLDNELRKIAEAFQAPQPLLKLSVSYEAPSKVADGFVALADGTSWNPGGGAGFYGYRGGAWRKLD